MDIVQITLKDIEDATVLFERKLSSATILHFRLEQCGESLRRIEPEISEAIFAMAQDLSDDVDAPWLQIMGHVDQIRKRVARLRNGEATTPAPVLSLVETPATPSRQREDSPGLPLRSRSDKPRAVLDSEAPWPVAVAPEPEEGLPEDPSDVPPSPSLENRRRL